MRALHYGVLSTMLFVTPLWASKAASVLVLTTQENGVDAQHEFTCYGKIHGYIRLPQRESDVHTLESRWVMPSGKIAADSRSTVNFRPARSTAYVWFAFPEPGLLPGIPDQTLAQESGTWQVNIGWDGKTLLQQSFQVRCP